MSVNGSMNSDTIPINCGSPSRQFSVIPGDIDSNHTIVVLIIIIGRKLMH